jgi:glycosyltransferase involved in cell wall biosynthesis
LRSADVAVFHEFRPPPYGGGNQFLLALVDEFERRGLRVERNTVSATTRACLFNSYNFDFDRLRALRRRGCRMVHRVDGPIGVYRGADDGTDGRIRAINAELADATVFQSVYSRRRHAELGLEFAAPTVIHNAVDPTIFHPSATPRRGGPLRLISVSWSDNPNKGGETYAWLDERLDRSRFEYTFVGRTAAPLPYGRTLPAVPSHEVAALLREHDVLVTASRHESCPNHVLEALACGLPVVYVDSGATGELVGAAGLPFDDREQLPALLDRAAAELDRLRAEIRVPTIADVADRYLSVLGVDAA